MGAIENQLRLVFILLSRNFLFIWTLTFGMLPLTMEAHPMPNSLLRLNVLSTQVKAEIQIPMSELLAAWGLDTELDPHLFLRQHQEKLEQYFLQHIRPVSMRKVPWKVVVDNLNINTTENPINGKYFELEAMMQLIPPSRKDLRHFVLHYDAVVHQVITHLIVVSIHQDWAAGKIEGEANLLGTIQLDIPSGRIFPLEVNLSKGNAWTGFVKMLNLGMEHIAEGTDHLLFLLALLLPAPLLSAGKKWGNYGGLRYSLVRLLKIVTAFTLGHSLTLLIGGLRWLQVPNQPIEVLIAVSILIAAIHAYRPVFAGKEIWIAAGFGLIHGLAFADTLIKLNLDVQQLVISLLGFNVGIELMQLFIISLTIPGLLLLSRTSLYPPFRVGATICVAIAALAWMIERISGQPNLIGKGIELLRTFAPLILVIITTMAIASYWVQHKYIPHQHQNR
jgi:hypothetical protein